MRVVKKLVGLVVICPCMLWLKVVSLLYGSASSALKIGSFQMLHNCWCCGCQVGLAGCSMIAIAPVCIIARSICIVLYRSFDPVIVCSCCLDVRWGSPCGCVESLSFGGPWITLSLIL